jgi:hypothetical protein
MNAQLPNDEGGNETENASETANRPSRNSEDHNFSKLEILHFVISHSKDALTITGRKKPESF